MYRCNIRHKPLLNVTQECHFMFCISALSLSQPVWRRAQLRQRNRKLILTVKLQVKYTEEKQTTLEFPPFCLKHERLMYTITLYFSVFQMDFKY